MRIQGSCEGCGGQELQGLGRGRGERAGHGGGVERGGLTQRMAAEKKSSLELTVRTEEGDEVTISATALQTLTVEKSPGSAQVGSNQQYELEVEVKGELSEEELADIAKLARALGKSVEAAEQGKFGKAARVAARFAANEEDSIAGFTFAYEASAQVEYVQRAYEGGKLI